jgi:hypothetical protein
MNAGGPRSAAVDDNPNRAAGAPPDPWVYLFFSGRLYRLFIGGGRNRGHETLQASLTG